MHIRRKLTLNSTGFQKNRVYPSNAIQGIIQDSKGFIWVATQNGINRYDGTSVKSYEHDSKDPSSISDAFVLCLCEDSDGNIWAGTMSEGLNKLDRHTDKFEIFKNDPKNDNSLSSNNIRALVYDDGKLWIGTQHGGLCVMDLKTKLHDIKTIRAIPLV